MQLFYFLVLSVALLFASAAQAVEPGTNQPIEQISHRIVRGEKFLAELFDPAMNLLPEFRESKTFWLFHDNYLAAKLLTTSHPALAAKINATLRNYGVTNSGKIEILFDEAPAALPFRAYNLTNVALIDGKQIRTEVVTTNVLRGWENYADLLLLAAIAQVNNHRAEAMSNLNRAAAMWDGHGFNDRATSSVKLYATYKLALYLIAAQRVGVTAPHAKKVLQRLVALQSESGGWITDYNAAGKPIGLANVETTCMALMALKTVSPGAPSKSE
jgi:hypothetical protein